MVEAEAADEPHRLFLRPFLWTVIVGWALVVAASTYFGAVRGDLTRVGHWSERDFAPRRAQLPIEGPENARDLASASIIVFGDSFSADNAWQGELSRTGRHRITTYHWEDVACLRGFLDPLERTIAGHERTVILQTAERMFVDRFGSAEACKPTHRLPSPRQSHAETVSMTRKLGFAIDGEHLVRTAINSMRLGLHPEASFRNATVNVPLSPRGNFSNHRADRLLFFREDDAKKFQWTPAGVERAIAHARAAQDELEARGFRVMLMVVPDKSSVYRDLIRDGIDRSALVALEPALAARSVHHVDLMHRLRRARDTITDLYLPNDTHLSFDGYRVVARSVAEHLSRGAPHPPRNTSSALEQASTEPATAVPTHAAPSKPVTPIRPLAP